MRHRDSSDNELTSYPRPSLAVDTAVLIVGEGPGKLDVLLHRRLGKHHGNEWALPGTFLHENETPTGEREGETLADAVLRSLKDKVGLVGTEPQQLHVFDRPGRDTRGWVLSVAHVVLLLRSAVDDVLAARPDDVRLRAADAATGLPFDHDDIVRLAVRHVRREHALRPDPFGLLADSFTLKRLHQLHEAVAPSPGPGEVRPSFDTFRRYMVDNGLVERTGETWQPPAGRPAHLYRRSRATSDFLGAVGVKPVRPARG
jgi:8-oxo-dGTP diphosphatase